VQAVACVLKSSLTLPSSGHPTAGFAVCWLPLMSNVRPLQMPSVLLHGSVSPKAGRSLLALAASSVFAAGKPAQRSLQLGCARICGASSPWASALAGGHLGAASAVPCYRSCLAAPAESSSVQSRHTRALRAGVLRRAVSTLSRLAAAMSFGTSGLLEVWLAAQSCLAAAGSGLLSSPGQWPNPSIERTFHSRLRRLWNAAHVKR